MRREYVIIDGQGGTWDGIDFVQMTHFHRAPRFVSLQSAVAAVSRIANAMSLASFDEREHITVALVRPKKKPERKPPPKK